MSRRAPKRAPRGLVARRGPSLKPCVNCAYEHNVATCPRCGQATARAYRADPRRIEEAHGMALIEWRDKSLGKYPDLSKLYHVPNGGARGYAEGGRLKAQGVRKGQLDYNLDVARGGWFGLRLELKAPRAELGHKPKVSPEQVAIALELSEDRYYAVVIEGWEAARDVLTWYLALPPTQATPQPQAFHPEGPTG